MAEAGETTDRFCCLLCDLGVRVKKEEEVSISAGRFYIAACKLPGKVKTLADEANEEATVALVLTLYGEENRFSGSNLEQIRED